MLSTLSAFGSALLAFVFVLGVLIFIHELGHFLVARYFGIRVDVFSLGFGRRLFGVKRGDTDYRVSLVPLGGYVKMSGENPDDELTGSPDEFLSKPKRERFLVAVAGPVMNIGLAVLLLAATFLYGREVPEYLIGPATVGTILDDSPADQAGLTAGDTIVSVNQNATPTWRDAEFRIGVNGSREISLEYRRGAEILQTTITPETRRDGSGSIGVAPQIPFLVAELSPDSPAQQSGIQKGDLIVSASYGGVTKRSFYPIQSLVQSSQGETLQLEVVRDGRTSQISIAPELTEEGPRLGAFVQHKISLEQLGPAEALQRSVQECVTMAKFTFVTIGRLVTGSSSMKQLSGPIEIARISGQVASVGLLPLAHLMAVISLQLGLFNLLPIPILDGGMIALLGIEGLMGRDLSLDVKERIFKVGFVFIVLLMGVVLFNDLAKNLPGL